MEIFSLFGSIFVDNDKANKGIKDTNTLASKLAKKFKGLGKVAAKLGKGIAVGVAAGGAAMIALAKKTGDAADRLLDMSSATGMSTDEIQRWEKVTTVAGVSADTMVNVSEKLTKQMDILSTGTGKASEAAEDLGLSFEDLNNMNADERMNAVVEALQAIEDPTERAKIGTDLLGGSFKELAPILDVGKEKLKGIKENANIISEENLNQANEFRIKIDQMKEKAADFGLQLGAKLAPTLNKIFDWFETNSDKIEEFFTTAFDKMSVAIAYFSNFMEEKVVPVLVKLFEWVKDNMPTIKTIFGAVFEAMRTVSEALWKIFEENLLPILENLFNWIGDNMPAIKEAFKVAFDVIIEVVENVVGIIQTFWDLMGDLFDFAKGTWQEIGPHIMGAFSGVIDFLQDVVEMIDNVVEGMSNAITKTLEFFGIVDEQRKKEEGDKYEGFGEDELGFDVDELFSSVEASFAPTGVTGGDALPIVGDIGANPLAAYNEFNIENMNVRNDQDVKDIAEELFLLQQETNRGGGVE